VRRGWSKSDDALIARLMPDGYQARPEQAILFTVAAWDINCSQHIPHASMPLMWRPRSRARPADRRAGGGGGAVARGRGGRDLTWS
jgi:hypothetical protein